MSMHILQEFLCTDTMIPCLFSRTRVCTVLKCVLCRNVYCVEMHVYYVKLILSVVWNEMYCTCRDWRACVPQLQWWWHISRHHWAGAQNFFIFCSRHSLSIHQTCLLGRLGNPVIRYVHLQSIACVQACKKLIRTKYKPLTAPAVANNCLQSTSQDVNDYVLLRPLRFCTERQPPLKCFMVLSAVQIILPCLFAWCISLMSRLYLLDIIMLLYNNYKSCLFSALYIVSQQLHKCWSYDKTDHASIEWPNVQVYGSQELESSRGGHTPVPYFVEQGLLLGSDTGDILLCKDVSTKSWKRVCTVPGHITTITQTNRSPSSVTHWCSFFKRRKSCIIHFHSKSIQSI